MFTPRPTGSTLRRQLQDAVRNPHPASERFDPDFPVAWQCDRCEKIGHGPRRLLEAAVDEHRRECPARLTHENKLGPLITRTYTPRI